MINKLTNESIRGLFKRKKVFSLQQLLTHFGCSYQCLWKYLREISYYTSYTHNSRYYTLSDCAVFDKNGIWFCNDPVAGKIGFTEHSTSKGLIVSLVDSSMVGLSEEEIRKITGIRVSNQLNLLTKEGKIKKVKLGRRYQYFTTNLQVPVGLSKESRHGSLPQEGQGALPEKHGHEMALKKLAESRDKWHQRSNENQRKVRMLLIQVRDLGRSRDKWKQKTMDYKKRYLSHQAELLRLKKTSGL